jgi:site-specific DNA recombinase
MTPSHTRKKNGRLYRYYVSTDAIRSGLASTSPIHRIPAADIETAVIAQIKRLVGSPEIIVATWRALRQQVQGLSELQVREHLLRFVDVWSELFPAEQARIIQLLVARVQISADGVDVTLRTDGITTLTRDLFAVPLPEEEAA